MKKFLTKSILIFCLTASLTCTTVFAQNPPATPAPTGTSNVTSASQLFYKVPSLDGTNDVRTSAVKNLPDKPWQQALAGIVKVLLNIAGALALLGFTIGGVLMIVGTQGKAELLDKGKSLIKAAIGGLIIIAISYALVIGVSELQFFTPGAGGGNTSTSGGAGAGQPAPAPAAGDTLPTSGQNTTP